MSFTKKPGRFETPRARFRLPRTPPGGIVRLALFALAAILAAAWAVAYHYTHEPAPMRVPVPTPAKAAPTYDADAGEIPVPELLAPGAR